MDFNFNFRSVTDTQDIRTLVEFISAQDLGYPDYDSWVQRTEVELSEGNKKAVMAHSNGYLVGNLIYQCHKDISELLEVKNLRVDPRFRVRSFGGFMLRQTEVEASRKGYSGVIIDARPERRDILQFLSKQGYTPIAKGPLYDPNSQDIILMKHLRNIKTQNILTMGKEFIEDSFL